MSDEKKIEEFEQKAEEARQAGEELSQEVTVQVVPVSAPVQRR